MRVLDQAKNRISKRNVPNSSNEQLQCLLFQLFRRQSQRLIAVTRRDGQQGRKNGCCPFEVSSTGKQQRFQLCEPFGGGVVVSYARESLVMIDYRIKGARLMVW